MLTCSEAVGGDIVQAAEGKLQDDECAQELTEHLVWAACQQALLELALADGGD